MHMLPPQSDEVVGAELAALRASAAAHPSMHRNGLPLPTLPVPVN